LEGAFGWGCKNLIDCPTRQRKEESRGVRSLREQGRNHGGKWRGVNWNARKREYRKDDRRRGSFKASPKEYRLKYIAVRKK